MLTTSKKSLLLTFICIVVLSACKKEEVVPNKNSTPTNPVAPKTNIDLVDGQLGYYFIADVDNNKSKMNLQYSKGFKSNRSIGTCIGPAGKYYHTSYTMEALDGSTRLSVDLYRRTQSMPPFSTGEQPFRSSPDHLYDGIEIFYVVPGTYYSSFSSKNAKLSLNIYKVQSNADGTKTYFAKASSLQLVEKSSASTINLSDIVLCFTV